MGVKKKKIIMRNGYKSKNRKAESYRCRTGWGERERVNECTNLRACDTRSLQINRADWRGGSIKWRRAHHGLQMQHFHLTQAVRAQIQRAAVAQHECEQRTGIVLPERIINGHGR